MTRLRQAISNQGSQPGPSRQGAPAPMVGITVGVEARGAANAAVCRMRYAEAVEAAGGVPVFLSPMPRLAPEHVSRCQAFVFTGGDDPRMECFGVPTHPKATRLHPLRQEYELALLEALRECPQTPVLGICLGMQMMALHAGGMLDQCLADTRPDAGRHWDAEHGIQPEPAGAGLIVQGTVRSRHRQGVSDPGRLAVAARSDDGLIEAVVDRSRAFYLGVQWHPEQTDDLAVGAALFHGLTASVGRPGRRAENRPPSG